MRCERSSNSTGYALLACLSTRDQVTYSVCRTLESFQGVTEPWHKLLAQFTAPRCLPAAWQGSGGSASAALRPAEPAEKAAATRSAMAGALIDPPPSTPCRRAADRSEPALRE